MNYKKILNDITKDFLNQKLKGENSIYCYGLYKEKVAFMPDPFRIIFIDSEVFPFDFKKLNHGLSKSMLEGIVTKLDKYDYAEPTGDKRDFDNGTAVKIANDKAHAWLNEKFLKIYDKDVIFKVSTQDKPYFKPVLVLSGSDVEKDLIGYILPVRMKEDVNGGKHD